MDSRLNLLLAAIAFALTTGALGSAPALALTVCPTSEFTVAFEQDSEDLTEEALDALAAAGARTRSCAADVTVVVRAYGSDRQLTAHRARATYDAFLAQSSSVNVRENHLSSCGTAQEDLAVVTIYFWIVPPPEPRVYVTCRGD